MNIEEMMAKVTFVEMGSRYCDACDRQDWDAALELFAEDAEIEATAVYGKTFNGHEEIHEFFSSAPACLGHHATGFYSDLISDTEAKARLKMMTMFKKTTFTVDYDWELVKTDGIWKVKRQEFYIHGQQHHLTEK